MVVSAWMYLNAILNTTKVIEFIKKLFGSGAKVNDAELVANGAMILDVWSKNEFSNGHITRQSWQTFAKLSNFLTVSQS